jgi:hypothetical protein
MSTVAEILCVKSQRAPSERQEQASAKAQIVKYAQSASQTLGGQTTAIKDNVSATAGKAFARMKLLATSEDERSRVKGEVIQAGVRAGEVVKVAKAVASATHDELVLLEKQISEMILAEEFLRDPKQAGSAGLAKAHATLTTPFAKVTGSVQFDNHEVIQAENEAGGWTVMYAPMLDDGMYLKMLAGMLTALIGDGGFVMDLVSLVVIRFDLSWWLG